MPGWSFRHHPYYPPPIEFLLCYSWHIVFRQAEIESGSITRRAFCPDISIMMIDYSFCQSQSYASTFKFYLVMQTLENTEQLMYILHIKPYTIIPDKIALPADTFLCSYFNDRISFL